MTHPRRFVRALVWTLALASIAGVGPPADAAQAPVATHGGDFWPPLPLSVLVAFRPAATPYSAGHRGVDLAAAESAAVTAAADGVIVFAGRLVDRGVVSIEHEGGLRTTYEPVDASVAAGDLVRRGDPIGRVETGHRPCAPATCLHFGARMPDRVYLDPLALFGPWQIRLKPFTDQLSAGFG